MHFEYSYGFLSPWFEQTAESMGYKFEDIPDDMADKFHTLFLSGKYEEIQTIYTDYIKLNHKHLYDDLTTA
jgi:hypothetical protein